MRAGLRTEITLSITLLMAAAILFAGFLLIKLTERNLLEQQRSHAVSLLRLMTNTLDLGRTEGNFKGDVLLDRLHGLLRQADHVSGWRLLDGDFTERVAVEYDMTGGFTSLPGTALGRGEIYEALSYTSFPLFADPQKGFLDLTTPIEEGPDSVILLQVRFSLEDLHARVLGSQKLVFVYALLYGLVLACFGVIQLNRKVVRPMRLLQTASIRVATGALEPVEVPAGPGEIRDLADSFNRMVAALAASRAETERHITSLEQANLALGRARDDLVRSEKLATVGQLAAGMAHEIGNPLGAVIGYLNILRGDLDEASRDLVERSLVETGRIDRLVRELLDYAAPGAGEETAFSAVALLREAVEMLQHQGQLDDVVVDDHCADDALVCTDRRRLLQVWINLLLNARDAVAGRGQVKLASRRDGERIRLTVRDDGPGIDAATAARIFDPFFTTKAPGSGYGLGLAVCQRIVDEAGGSLALDTAPGAGAAFTVTLPVVQEANGCPTSARS